MARKFECKKCGEFIVAKWVEHGGTAKCRNCGGEMTVPEKSVEVSTEVYEEYLKSGDISAKVVFCGRCGTKLEATCICQKCGSDNTEVENSEPEENTVAGRKDSLSRRFQDIAGRKDSLSRRYQDAYNIANSIISNGEMVKGLGMFLAFIIAIAGVGFGVKMEMFSVAAIGIVAAFSVGLILNACGAIIMALGQMLLASLDSAVNTSPLINAAQKAKIIGVDFSIIK